MTSEYSYDVSNSDENLMGYHHDDEEISNSNIPRDETEKDEIDSGKEGTVREIEEQEQDDEQEEEKSIAKKNDEYFPVNKIRGRHVYAEAVRYLEHLGYKIQCTEKEYYALKTSKKVPALCPNDHGLRYVCLADIRRGISGCMECGIMKGQATCMKRYGVKCGYQQQNYSAKIKENNMKKYGVPHTSQLPEVREKVKQTNLKNLGCENPMQSEEVKAKSRATCLEVYGHEYANQSEEVKEKMKATNLEVRGCEYAIRGEDVQAKVKATMLKKFGCENAFQSEEVKAKIKATNLEVYGTEHPMQNEEVKAKAKATNLKVYGTECPLQNEEIKAKSRATCLEVYGCEYSLQSEEVKAKGRATNLENLGVEYPMQSKEVQAKSRATSMEHYGTEHPMQNAEVFAKQQKSALKKKEYIFPSGRKTLIQGYEGYCLNDLVNKEGIKEENIRNEVENVPAIWYNFKNERKRYYPDIFLIEEKLIIEVKSKHYFEKDKEKNMAKAFQCVKDGFRFEFRIYNDKGGLISRIPITTES